MQLLRVFFFTQQSAYAMRISDWSADVFSSYLLTSPYQSYMTGRSILSWRRFSYMCRIWRTPLTDKTKSNPGSKRPARNGASEKTWGAKVIALGFCILPSLLLRDQRRLGLTPTQLAVLIQPVDFCWDTGSM